MDLSERPSTEFRRHPWELSRWRFFARLLRHSGLLAGPQRVLDVGSGDGWFLTELLNELPAGSSGVGWDLGYDAATFSQLGLRARPNLHFTHAEPDERFTLVLMLDVLEHVQHDAAFLAERVTKNLEDGARVLVSVPSWPVLYSSHDVALGHFRRYRPRQLLELLAASGLEVQASGGLFHALTVPRAVSCIREALHDTRQQQTPAQLEWRGGPLLTRSVDFALDLDNRLSFMSARRGLRVPGLSFWALCSQSAPYGSARPSRPAS